jgi:alpha-L-fucosidase
MVQTVAYGGNILINVGPTADGRIETIYEERLLQLGSWLKANGESIYKTAPWKVAQNDSLVKDVYYTASHDQKTVYVIVMDWPKGDFLTLGSVKSEKDPSQYKVSFLKTRQELSHGTGPEKQFQVNLSSIHRSESYDVAFVLKIEGL